jgi:iron complex outermembrane receptor protein
MDQVIPGSGFPFPLDPLGFRTPNLETDVRGGDLILSWGRQISEDQSTELQFYYDNRVRNSRALAENRRTFDLDFQHQVRLSESNDLIWGAGWRLNTDRLDESLNIDFTDSSSQEALYSGFVQDEMVLVPERLTFTAGSKVEYNTYTGWEIQPSARMLYTPVQNQQLWGAVSRAVRTPNRAERELAALTPGVFPPGFDPICDLVGPPCAVQIVGNEDFESETLIAYELGYRIQPTSKLALDFATFFNDYQNLVSVLPASPLTPFTLVYGNRGEARGYGFEAAAQWQAKDWWKLASTFTTLRVADEGTLGDEAGYGFSLRSMMDLPGNVELDTSFYFTGDFDTANLTGTSIDVAAHWRTDVRLAWKPRPGLELSLVGQNLLDPNEPEWVGLLNPNGIAEVPRSFYGKVTWEF